MPAILTNKLRITNGDYFQNDISEIPTYLYIGRTTAWGDEQLPPDAVDSTNGRADALQEVQALKRIYSSDIISVAQRYDWIDGDVYDEYTDVANMIDDKNPVTNEYYKFYVVTDEFNVYKCLSNYKRSQSTTKPSGTSTTPFTTPDGYIWKFMYTIKSPDVFKFMTPNWIPCYNVAYNDNSIQWQVQDATVPGSIEHIAVVEDGAEYVSTDLPNVTITGDGTGATAVAEVDDLTGTIDRIVVTNAGSGYTEATVTLSGSTVGGGATARPVISPRNGHGSDARLELGATHKMVRTVIDGDEGGDFPTNIDYRIAGILKEPRSNDAGVALAIASTNLFSAGETITGSSSSATGTIRSVSSIDNLIYVESVSGVFENGETVSSQSYNSTAVLDILNDDNIPITSATAPSSGYKSNSGDILFTSNRTSVSRNTNQIEEIKLIISF